MTYTDSVRLTKNDLYNAIGGDMITQKIIGAKLRQHRKASKMTLQDVQQITGRAVATISKIERGKASLYADELFLLAEAFEVNVYDFGEWRQNESI